MAAFFSPSTRKWCSLLSFAFTWQIHKISKSEWAELVPILQSLHILQLTKRFYPYHATKPSHSFAVETQSSCSVLHLHAVPGWFPGLQLGWSIPSMQSNHSKQSHASSITNMVMIKYQDAHQPL